MSTANDKQSSTGPSTTTWIAGLIVRTLFIAILIVITARVASPQLERITSIYETPSDLVRVLLGFAVCAWLAFHIFILPKDPGGYRTWVQLGAVLLPLAILCVVVAW